jgi:hypothetical protein
MLVGCTEDHSEEVQEEQTVQVAKIDTSEVDRFFKSLKDEHLTDEQIGVLVKLLLKIRVPQTVEYIEENNLQWIFPYLYSFKDSELSAYSYSYNRLSHYNDQIWDYIRKKSDYRKLTLSELKAFINLDIYIKEDPEAIIVYYGNLLMLRNSNEVIKLFLEKCSVSTEWKRVEILSNFTNLSNENSKRVVNSFSAEIEKNINIIDEPYTDETLFLKIMTLLWAKKYNLRVNDQVISKCFDLIG